MPAQSKLKPKRKLLLLIYGIWAALLTISYFTALVTKNNVLLPFIWGAIGISGIAAIITGVIINKPSSKAPWLLFAAANIAFISGDIYFKVLHYIAHLGNPYPSFADVLYLITYPLFAVGMYILIRRRAARNDRSNFLDALTLTIGLMLFIWVYLVLPNASATDATFLARMTSVAYPLGDVLVWAFLARLFVTDFRTRSAQFLALGAFGLVAADIIYGFGQFYGFWVEGNPTDLGWILFYIGWGAAALHPSMTQLTERLSEDANRIRARRLILLAAAALVAPAILFVEGLRGNGSRVAGTIAVFSTVLFILVILRMYILSKELTRREADKALAQEKNEVLAITSHQLRTPLTIIKLYSELMTDAQQKQNLAEAQNAIRAISGANDRMVEIVNRLIHTTELDLGTVQFKIIPTAIDKVVNDALADNDPLLKDKNVHLQVTTEPGLPMGLTDAEALREAIGNVVSNAFQYNASNDRQVHVAVKADNGSIVVSIADNGAGIPSEDQKKLFSKLFRASNARTLLPDGSGLGLYLSKNILDHIGNTIRIDSTLGMGTTVYITVPIASAAAKSPESEVKKIPA